MAPSVDVLIERNKACDIEFPQELWKNISAEALDLIVHMTDRDPYSRLSAKDCLEHKWFSLKFESPVPLKKAIENMHKYGE